jgi:hypothetical protein
MSPHVIHEEDQLSRTIDIDRNLAGTAATVAFAGAFAWIALAGDSILRPDPRDYRDALLLAPWTLYAATLACIHWLQRHRAGALEQWSFRLVMVAAALVAIGSVDRVIGTEAVQVLGFPLGVLAWTLSMAALGAGTVRAGVFPRRVGWAIALSQPLTVAVGVALSPIVPLQEWGSYSGALAHGAVMLLLAAAFRNASRSTEVVDRRGATAVA